MLISCANSYVYIMIYLSNCIYSKFTKIKYKGNKSYNTNKIALTLI